MTDTIERVELWGDKPSRTHLKIRGDDRTLCGDAQPSASAYDTRARTRGNRIGIPCEACERERTLLEARRRARA